jgi:uncharacterized membrane protein YdbT with pleckstrin-like domain
MQVGKEKMRVRKTHTKRKGERERDKERQREAEHERDRAQASQQQVSQEMREGLAFFCTMTSFCYYLPFIPIFTTMLQNLKEIFCKNQVINWVPRSGSLNC